MKESRAVSAELVTSGTEILLGDIVDTNAAWIAQQLREIGVNIYYKTTVGDNEPRLRGVLEMALARSDVVLVTGGLGPTAGRYHARLNSKCHGLSSGNTSRH